MATEKLKINYMAQK